MKIILQTCDFSVTVSMAYVGMSIPNSLCFVRPNGLPESVVVKFAYIKSTKCLTRCNSSPNGLYLIDKIANAIRDKLRRYVRTCCDCDIRIQLKWVIQEKY